MEYNAHILSQQLTLTIRCSGGLKYSFSNYMETKLFYKYSKVAIPDVDYWIMHKI